MIVHNIHSKLLTNEVAVKPNACPTPALERGLVCKSRKTTSLHASRQQQPSQRGARLVTTQSGSGAEIRTHNGEDLWQYPDRDRWYAPTFMSDDAPDWNPARFVSRRDVAPGVRELVLEVEISRDKVPLRNAYVNVGQNAWVRVNAGEDYSIPVATAPFPPYLQHESLLKARGDLLHDEIKVVKDDISTMATLQLLVDEKDAPDLFNMTDEDFAEMGPFQGGGINLRNAIRGFFQYPTIVMFCQGMGIAAAKALIESEPETSSNLTWNMRQGVRLYYKAPNESSIIYRELFIEWEQKYGVLVRTSTRDTFSEMFDDDETLEYIPERSAAVVLTGDDTEAEEEALEACKDAEITCIVKQSDEMPTTKYI